jgi:hypothetical protein
MVGKKLEILESYFSQESAAQLRENQEVRRPVSARCAQLRSHIFHYIVHELLAQLG